MAYLTLFGWSFLAATIVPIGSEAAVVVLVRSGYSIAAIVGVATLGNYLGACTTYALARAAARALRSKTPSPTEGRATRLVAAYGAPALLFSWVPLLGDAIVAAAGIAEIPFAGFSVWTAIGKLVRYGALAWAALVW